MHSVSGFPPRGDGRVVLPVNGPPTLFVRIDNHRPDTREIAVIRDNRLGGASSPEPVGAHLREAVLERAPLAAVGPVPPSTWAA